MARSVLVLGASRYQLEAIRTAKRLGYRVVTTDNVPENPGHALADASYGVDTTDPEGVLRVAREEGIVGVLAPATDVAVPTAAHVAQALGLRGVPPRAAATLCDKCAFRRFQCEAGLPTPEFMILENARGALSMAWPGGEWILKPTRSSGSKGVVVLRRSEDLQEAWPWVEQYAGSRPVMLERFIDGHQGTVEGLLDEGQIRLRLFTDRLTADRPYCATAGHVAPSRISAALRSETERQLTVVFSRLGVRDGPFDADFVAARGVVYLLEVTPRLGGNCLSRLMLASMGFDITEYAVRWACGEWTNSPDTRAPKPAAVRILGVPRAGRLAYDRAAMSDLRHRPGVLEIDIDYPPSAHVTQFRSGRDRVGEVLVQAASRAEVEELLRFVCSALSIAAE